MCAHRVVQKTGCGEMQLVATAMRHALWIDAKRGGRGRGREAGEVPDDYRRVRRGGCDPVLPVVW